MKGRGFHWWVIYTTLINPNTEPKPNLTQFLNDVLIDSISKGFLIGSYHSDRDTGERHVQSHTFVTRSFKTWTFPVAARWSQRVNTLCIIRSCWIVVDDTTRIPFKTRSVQDSWVHCWFTEANQMPLLYVALNSQAQFLACDRRSILAGETVSYQRNTLLWKTILSGLRPVYSRIIKTCSIKLHIHINPAKRRQRWRC
jgi:hypothetical protein